MGNKKTIYALGFFDGVHLGHQALLRACCDLAERSGAKPGVLTFDGHPDALVRGAAPKLINTLADRHALLRRYGMETIVTLPFDENMMTMPWQAFITLLVEDYGAAGLVCGEDFRFGYRGEGDARKLRQACGERNIPCAVVPDQTVDGIRVSSTQVRSLLEAGQTERALDFLGHPHILTGRVVGGRRLGRTIGVPTANLALPEDVLCPRMGVYACMAAFEGQRYPAVANVGTRPTVGGSHITVEPWILGYTGDLYDTELKLEFYRFLRPERKFDCLEELQREIRKNAEETLEFFRKT